MLRSDYVADWDGLQDCYGDARPVLKALKSVEALPPVREYTTAQLSGESRFMYSLYATPQGKRLSYFSGVMVSFRSAVNVM